MALSTRKKTARFAKGSGHLGAALKIINDQIVAGGQNVVKQTAKGGIAFMKQVASFFGVHDLEDHINATI
jgi:hypothetical protein